MGELFASIKAFLEKVNLIIFLLSIAVAILIYQIVSKEPLWAIFAFCVSYVLFTGIQKLFNNYWENVRLDEQQKAKEEGLKIKQQEEEAKRKDAKDYRNAHLRTLYDTLPDDVKEGLILLYQLPQPQGGYLNSRIIKDGIENVDKITNAYHQVRVFLNLENIIQVTNSIKSTIVTIDPDFLEVLKEKVVQ